MDNVKYPNIFVVTTLQIDSPASERYNMVRCRSVGWFPTLEMARETVELNYGDIYEDSYHSYVVIEETAWGLYQYGSEVWYRWNNTLLCDEGYVETEKPRCMKNTRGFGMG